MRWCALVAFLLVCLFSSTSEAVNKDKLRKTARLPKVEASMGVGINSQAGFFLNEVSLPKESIEDLQSSLKNNPADADIHVKLAKIYGAKDQWKFAEEHRQKAIECFQQQLERSPRDSKVWAKLGYSQMAAGDLVAAKKSFMQAITRGATNPEGWWGLADYNVNRAWVTLLGGMPRSTQNFEALLQMVQVRRPLSADFTTAFHFLNEAEKCHTRAVQGSRRDPEVYAKRAGFTFMSAFIERGLNIIRSEQPVDPNQELPFAKITADLQKVVQLQPDNHRAIGMIATLTMFSNKSIQQVSTQGPNWKNLGDDQQATIKKCQTQLEKLSKNNNKKTAAEVAELLGFLFFTKNDEKQMLEWYRKSVNLDPGREKSWTILIGLLAQKKDDDLIATTKKYVEYKDCSETRYLLAKAYDVFGKNAEAEKEIAKALDHDPTDYRLNLAMAAALLRRADDAKTLEQVKDYIVKTERLSANVPTSRTFKAEAWCTGAIYLALTGETKRAREIAQFVVTNIPEYAPAQATLDALKE